MSRHVTSSSSHRAWLSALAPPAARPRPDPAPASPRPGPLHPAADEPARAHSVMAPAPSPVAAARLRPQTTSRAPHPGGPQRAGPLDPDGRPAEARPAGRRPDSHWADADPAAGGSRRSARQDSASPARAVSPARADRGPPTQPRWDDSATLAPARPGAHGAPLPHLAAQLERAAAALAR
jgi:hypothetical protein